MAKESLPVAKLAKSFGGQPKVLRLPLQWAWTHLRHALAFAKDTVGPQFSNIATYLCAGAAMVVGSLLKPRAKTAGTERG